MALPDCLQHICYENEIPPEVAQLFERIYQSPFSVIKYFEIFRDQTSLNALTISHGDADPDHVLAYVVSGKGITVLNELVEIDQEYLRYFSATVFNRYPAVTSVNFNCIQTGIENLPYPWRQWKRSHDIALALPGSFDEYTANLGRQTRKHLRYYLNRLQREYGDFAFRTAATEAIDPTVIGRIIEMNRLRMKGKNIRSGFDRLFEKRIVEFCRHYGRVCTVSVQGRIVAGAICYEVGNHAYLEAIAHDPGYDKYNVGQVCLYLTIGQMIAKGKVSFHMLWGENEYKYRFLGVKHELSFLTVYRSASAKLAGMPKLLRHAYARTVQQAVYVTNKYLINRLRRT